MMLIDGRRKPQNLLQQNMDESGLSKVLATNDLGDLLVGIIHDNRKVVGRGHILARHDDIANFGYRFDLLT